MMVRQWLFVSLGLLLLVTSVFTPAVLERAVHGGLGILGDDYLLVGLMGIVALLGASIVLVSGRAATLQQADVPNPERPVRAPHPGSHIDHLLERWWIDLPFFGRQARSTVREELQHTAIEVVRQHTGTDRETACRLVENGGWTDDDRACVFLQSPPRRSRTQFPIIVGIVLPGSLFGRRARQTIDALHYLAEHPIHRRLTVDEDGGGRQ